MKNDSLFAACFEDCNFTCILNCFIRKAAIFHFENEHFCDNQKNDRNNRICSQRFLSESDHINPKLRSFVYSPKQSLIK